MERKYSIHDVIRFLQDGVFPQKLTVSSRKALVKYAKRFTFHNDKLFYCDSGKERLVVMSDAEKAGIFAECHGDKCAGAHFGRNKTLAKISRSFYWLGMTADIVSMIRQCHQCQKMEKLQTVAPQLHPIATAGPWDIVGIDLVGPLPETSGQNRYIMTMTDLFSKWVESFAIKNKSADTVASVLEKAFLRFGPPNKILTDQGREFVNSVNDSILQKHAVKHLVTSAYHPQTNGQDERTNQTIRRALSKLVNDNQDDWDTMLARICYDINTSKHDSTKASPFMVMHGWEPRLFSQLLNTEQTDDGSNVVPDQNASSNDCADTSVHDFVHNANLQAHIIDNGDNSGAHTVREQLLARVHANIKAAQNRQKLQYAARINRGSAKSFSFTVGAEVLRRNSRKLGRMGGKLQPEWFGPYIIETLTSTRAGLRGLKAKIPLSDLKPYMRPPHQAVSVRSSSCYIFQLDCS
jgi:hypothetical protein